MAATLTIEPLERFDAVVRPPGSKSLTNRALLLAALSDGPCWLTGVGLGDDTRVMIDALERLGFGPRLDETQRVIEVEGQSGRIPARAAELFLGNAGTAMRFLTAAVCLGHGLYMLDGVARMRQRPIGQLVEPLRQIGGQLEYTGREGFPPITVRAGGLAGGRLKLRPTLSSQYVSALLQTGPYMRAGVALEFDGPVTSLPYVMMTVRLMEWFGAKVRVEDNGQRMVVAPGRYGAREYAVEPDASNASYFLAAAAISPGSRCVAQGLGRSSLQGDVGFAEVLGRMGARVDVSESSIAVWGPGQLTGIDVDLNAMPDMAQTLAVVSLFAHGPTVIRNIGNLRVKETDRLEALRIELSKLGAHVSVEGDDLHIGMDEAGRLRAASIHTYDDHRMAMAFAVAGLRRPGITINDPGCVNKTYPEFWQDLNRLRGENE